MTLSSGNVGVLSEHRIWRFVVFLMLYVAQGIPFGLIAIAMPAYMANQGVDALTISAFLGIVMLPHAIKLVNGPIMDRWTFWPMGKRRPWVLIAQCILVAVFGSLALVPDPLNNIGILTAICFTINFFVGFQDVATDGMAVDILPVEDQPRATSIMFGGATVSAAVSSAAGGWALNRYGVAIPSIACAGLIALISSFLLVSRERLGERLLPWTEGRATIDPLYRRPENLREIGRNLRAFLFLRASLLAIAATTIYQFGRGIFLAMMPLYYVKELEWSDTAYSGLTGTALLIGGLFSMVFGGTILNFFGRTRAFQILCALVAALGLLLAVAPWLGEFDGAMKAYRLVYMILDTMVIVAFISVAMAICSKQVAATQFAMYMALGNVGYSAGSAAFGPLGLMLSYESIFVVFASVSIAAIIAMRGISIVDHRAEVERLQGGT